MKNNTQQVIDPLEPSELEDSIYVIGSESKPVRICTDSVRYKWDAISEPILIKNKVIKVYKGDVVLIKNGETKKSSSLP